MDETVLSLNRKMPDSAGDPAEILAAAPAFLDVLPIAAYACDAGGRLRWFNRRASDLWGRMPQIGDESERFCGAHKIYRMDGTLISREETPMAQVLRTGVAVSGKETSVERPDGSRIVVMVHIDPLKDAAGAIIGAINCFHDVTEVKQADRELRDSERQVRELLDSLPAAIYTTDATGRINYYNQAAVELSGRRPKLGSDEWCVTWKLYEPDGTPLPHDECPMAVALKEDRPVRGVEAVAERPDGTRVPFLPYPTPLHDATGAVIGAVNMLVDISQRQEAETQQRMLFNELNHRIKNNMQMMESLLRVTQRETHNAEAHAALTDAIRRVGAMAAAQKALYQADNAAAYSARDFLAAVCDSSRQAFGSAVNICCEPASDELPNDTAVPLALILSELLANAVLHGLKENSRGEIRVGFTKTAKTYILRVEDDGPGFELKETRRRSSGLGLVAGLVRQLGGSFEVEPMPGARCTVRFPERSATRA